jgi:hypothetical protein
VIPARLAALGAVGLVVVASGQPADPARWRLDLGSGPRRPGDVFTVKATVDLAEGWRLYSLSQPPGGPLATRIWLASDQPWVLAGPVEGPEPITEYDHVFEMDVESYVGRAEFDIPVRGPGASTGVPLQVRARYQMCNGERCLRPKTVRLELVIPDRGGTPSP